MDHHRSHSDCSDYSSASDHSIDCPASAPHAPPDWSDDCSDYSSASDHSKDRPPAFNCDGNQPEDMSQREFEDELERRIEELQAEFDRNHQPLIDKIKELNDATDKLESMHKNPTVGSLVGSSIGAAGGIAAIAGVCFAPLAFVFSLALTVAGVFGGAAKAASNITNTVKLKKQHETIEKIIKDFLNTIKPTIELMGKIHDMTEQVEQTFNQHEILKGAGNILKAQIGKICAEAAKELCVYVKAVNAAHGSAQAAKEIRVVAAAAGGLSALFRAVDVNYIVQDSTELSEMNQPADKRKAEDIKSETLKFILQTRETADQFKKIVDTITDTIDRFKSRPI